MKIRLQKIFSALGCLLLGGGLAGCGGGNEIQVYIITAEPSPPASWDLASPFGPEKARFRIDAADANGTASVSLSVLPGDGGGLLGNVNRWRKQLGLEPLAEQDLAEAVRPVEALGPEARLVDINGSSPRFPGETRLVGVIVPRKELTWFYKLMGSAPVVDGAKAEFLNYLPHWR